MLWLAEFSVNEFDWLAVRDEEGNHGKNLSAEHQLHAFGLRSAT